MFQYLKQILLQLIQLVLLQTKHLLKQKIVVVLITIVFGIYIILQSIKLYQDYIYKVKNEQIREEIEDVGEEIEDVYDNLEDINNRESSIRQNINNIKSKEIEPIKTNDLKKIDDFFDNRGF